MDCPNCGRPTYVVDSRPGGDKITRWRKCTACKYKFKTIETITDFRRYNK